MLGLLLGGGGIDRHAADRIARSLPHLFPRGIGDKFLPATAQQK